MLFQFCEFFLYLMRTEQQILPPCTRQNIFILFSLFFPADGKPSMIHSVLKGAFQSSNPCILICSLSLFWLHICFSLLFKTLLFCFKHKHFFLNFFTIISFNFFPSTFFFIFSFSVSLFLFSFLSFLTLSLFTYLFCSFALFF